MYQAYHGHYAHAIVATHALVVEIVFDLVAPWDKISKHMDEEDTFWKRSSSILYFISLRH